MKHTLHAFYSILIWLASTSAMAGDDIDTTAVSKLIDLQASSVPLNVTVLEENYLSTDAGGLSILKGRFQKVEHLFHYYVSLRPDDWANIAQCAAVLRSLDSAFSAFKTSLTDITGIPLHDVKAYGVVGAGNTAATASPTGVVLGLELICAKGDLTTTTRLKLKNYLAHELVHVVQYRLTKRSNFNFNLLELSLLEGSADYIAEMLLGTEYVLDDARNEYGVQYGRDLITRFKTSMLTHNFAPWLYTPSTTMPMDMGYWIGYQVANAFIINGGSVVALLTLEDAQAIFDKANITINGHN